MDAPTFRADDLVEASGIPAAGLEMLVKTKLAPPSEGGGRGSPRIYKTHALSQTTLTGAFFSACLELTPAARLAEAISNEFTGSPGYIPDRLDDFALKADSTFSLLKDVPTDEFGAIDRFGLFCSISKNYPEIDLNLASKGDFFIEIIDRRFVFLGNLDFPAAFSPFSGKASEVTAAYRLEGWERGSQGVRVIPLTDELPPIGTHAPGEEAIQAWQQAGANLEREYFAAHGNAVSALRVNLSLAVRRGFFAVIKHRGARAAHNASLEE